MKVLFRAVVYATCASLIAGGTGFGLSWLFMTSPLQRILGPRYSEFDFIGVLGVTAFSFLLALVGGAFLATRSIAQLRDTFSLKELKSLVVIPETLLLIATVALSGEWVWAILIHLAVCVGILCVAGIALHMRCRDNNA